MFTGIIEEMGIIKQILEMDGNRQFWIYSPLAVELKIDQSLAHDGVCLTVDALDHDLYRVTAVAETLAKTNINNWKLGDYINLERALVFNGRIDGHFVQGHVDVPGICTRIEDKQGSWELCIQFPSQFAYLIIEKGSVAVNGVSLTTWNVGENDFSVAIIPFTYQHTNLRYLTPGKTVNLEFDMIGKYIHRLQKVNQLP